MLVSGERAGAAAVAGDQDMIGLGFGHAGGNRADAHFAHQLHADAGGRVGVLQIVNELGQIFNRVNVMVRRRGNQPHARRRMPQLADVFVHLMAGKLAAFAGLGALGHLDLQFIGIDEILGGHAKASAGHLLDGRAAKIAVGVAL